MRAPSSLCVARWETCWWPSVWSLMAPHRCHAVRKAVQCPCITLCQPSMIPDVFDTKQQWWKDPPTHISNLYHFNRVPHLNTLQGTCSLNTATRQVLPAQPSSVTSCAGWDSISPWRYFQTCKQTQALVRMHIFAYYTRRVKKRPNFCYKDSIAHFTAF